MLLPPTGYQYEKIRPLNSISSVEQCEKQIRTISELNYTVKVLLAAQSRIRGNVPLLPLPLTNNKHSGIA